MQTTAAPIEWTGKLQNMLQVMAFCLAVAALQYAFEPERPYGPPAIHSLWIGTLTWAVIDIGREFIPSAAETGWPRGAQGLLLVLAGIVVGYLVGTYAADAMCKALGLYAGMTADKSGPRLRSSILITVMAGIAGSYYFYNVNRSAYLERKMSEARKHANEARLKLLETQLEPHMLFNTLANLRALIAVEPVAAQAMLDRMIAYLRATLTASRAAHHPLAAEFERLRDYLELMAVRMGPRLRYTLDLPPELAAQPVPTLLLQPLVENSIKHGLELQVEGGLIAVRAAQRGGRLWLEVSDTGAGRPHDPAAPAAGAGQGSGFGLAQVRERLATAYGDAATVEAGPQSPHGWSTTLGFPLAS